MLNFWLQYSHVDDETLLRAAMRTKETMDSVAPESGEWWKACGMWRIDAERIAWASAWEIDAYECNSSVEAQVFHSLKVRSEQHCERVFDAMLTMEQTASEFSLKRFRLAV